MSNEVDSAAYSESGKWCTFRLAGEMFALPVEDVQEVLMPQPLTPVPLAADYIVGLLNLRGQIMPTIDLRRRLHFEPRPSEKAGIFLVLHTNEGLLSIVVDEVGDVLQLPSDSWRGAPETLSAEHRSFVFGICPIEHEVVLGLRVGQLSGEEQANRERRPT